VNAAQRRQVDNGRVRYAHLAGPAYGNGFQVDDAAAPGNSRGGPAARYQVVGSKLSPRHPDGEPFSVNGISPNDQGWHRDRHVWVDKGDHATTGRESGIHDPLPDGPVRPSLRLLLTGWRRESGTDSTRNFDPKRRGYIPVGWQDGSPTRIWGGTPGFFQAYGSRGTGELLEADSSGNVMIPGSTPHGLHTHTVNPRRNTLKTYRDTPQMRPGRQDRLANSTRAGQSYSQTTVTQGSRR
jgi:hypothetical protein